MFLSKFLRSKIIYPNNFHAKRAKRIHAKTQSKIPYTHEVSIIRSNPLNPRHPRSHYILQSKIKYPLGFPAKAAKYAKKKPRRK